MTKYIAYFRTDAAYASQTVRAKSPEHALKKARRIAEEDEANLWFESYDDGLPINEIAICGSDDLEIAVWYDEDVHLRLGARELLSAARLVIERWEGADLAEAVRALDAAIAQAEGRVP